MKSLELIRDINILRNEWNEVLSRSNFNSVFGTYEWLKSWIEVFATDQKQFIICIRDNSEIIAIAPLIIIDINEYGIKFKRLQFIGTGTCDYMDFIIIRDSVECISMFFDFINSKKKLWDFGMLHNLNEMSPTLGILESIKPENPLSFEKSEMSLCPYLPINCSISELLQSRKVGLRYDLKRGESELQKIGILTYGKIEDRSDALNSLPFFFDMAEKREISVSRITNNRNLHNRRLLFKKFIENENLWLNINFFKISLDGNPIAFHFGFEYGNKLYWYKPTFNIDYAKYSLGKLLIKFSFEYAFNKGYNELDFLEGDEQYKSQWTSLKRINYGIHFCNSRVNSWFVYRLIVNLKAIIGHYKSFLKKIFSKIVK